MGKIRSFKPIVSDKCKVLILGSMPGKQSLEKEEYYGNPRNHFWHLIYSIFDEDSPSESYSDRVAFLLMKGIALWDVLETCERKGSLDKDIENESINQIDALLSDYPDIKCIFFNGSKAYHMFNKYFQHLDVNLVKLPSSSPVPTKYYRTMEDKLEAWRRIRDYL